MPFLIRRNHRSKAFTYFWGTSRIDYKVEQVRKALARQGLREEIRYVDVGMNVLEDNFAHRNIVANGEVPNIDVLGA